MNFKRHHYSYIYIYFYAQNLKRPFIFASLIFGPKKQNVNVSYTSMKTENNQTCREKPTFENSNLLNSISINYRKPLKTLFKSPPAPIYRRKLSDKRRGFNGPWL